MRPQLFIGFGLWTLAAIGWYYAGSIADSGLWKTSVRIGSLLTFIAGAVVLTLLFTSHRMLFGGSH
jgi:hypothetical protein